MDNNDFNVSNKKSAGKGNGNTVINNHEYGSTRSTNKSNSSTSSGQIPDVNTYSKTKKNQ